MRDQWGRSGERAAWGATSPFTVGVDHVLDGRAPARPPVASFVVADAAAPTSGPVDRLLAAPGWISHAVCLLGALGVLWAASAPASPIAGGDLRADRFAWLGLACALIWAVRLVVAIARGRVDWAYLVAPLAGLVVAGAIYLEIPEQMRWMQAEGGFENTLRALPTAKNWDPVAAQAMIPSRIGSYRVDRVSRDAGGAAQFHLDGGSAFTYLVDGVTTEVAAANPGFSFEQLHGNWYVLRTD